MRKLSWQKIFCVVSCCFILSCCFFYGSRLIKFYLKENNKNEKSNSIVNKIKDNNKNNDKFKKIEDDYYFINDSDNNYIVYSNMLWRIVNINNGTNIKIVLDNSITSLAYGENKDYEESYLINWLNSNSNNYSGILENNLNNINKYLVKTKVCIDETNEELNNCTKTNEDNYIGLLSINDYINTGKEESFIINEQSYYLANKNEDGEIWYIEKDNLKTNNGTSIIGVRPVITINGSISYESGNGTKEEPYYFEKESTYFASYVKLGNETWRIYNEDDNELRLVLTKTLETELKFSTGTSYFNDTKASTGPYYMNHEYLNNLEYKNIIENTTWSNGYYGTSNNYDYTKALDTKIESRIAFLSVGDVIFDGLSDYYIMTGVTKNGASVYTIKDNYKLTSKTATSKAKLLPTICIKKELLTKGKGTLDSPYEME